jgi:hypothetical protein
MEMRRRMLAADVQVYFDAVKFRYFWHTPTLMPAATHA